MAFHDADIKALIAALNDLSASEVWAYVTRTLTSFAPLSNYIYKGTGTEIPADKSLYDVIVLDRLDNVTFGLAALNNDLDTLLSRLGDPSPSTIKALIDAIEAKLDNGTYGLSALQTLLIAIEGTGFVKDTHSLVNVVGYVDEIEGLLKNASYGLSALKTLIDAVEGKLDNATYGLNALKTLINAIEAKLDNATYGLSALNTDLDSIISSLDNGTYGLSALNTDLDKLLTGIIQGTGTVLPSNKSLYDILWVDRNLDESGSFNWDTSEYTTVEQIISSLFTTPLTGTTRRKYWVYLDMTNPAADGAAWTTCTIKVKVSIDGTNYRTIDKATKAKTDLATTAEPGVPIEIPPVAQNVQITMQFDVALAANQIIYYHVVQEKMEY